MKYSEYLVIEQEARLSVPEQRLTDDERFIRAQMDPDMAFFFLQPPFSVLFSSPVKNK